ncbi:MAG: sigma-54-dependent Fis family transcriptional regulator [Desulfobacula sp.]|nr:sigma-54-dependent Fis family transcriptional regulator [Desulfobacula sp.]MBT7261610.1 sigma-54-dependent Fis family transcriptional regulator [Desulfobacula sp.]
MLKANNHADTKRIKGQDKLTVPGEIEIFNLLFVDDEQSILSSLKRIFSDEGYRLLSADSGEDALELLRRHDISAAVIDLKMPQMDGLELLEQVRKSYPCVRVVMLTAHGSIKDAVDALKVGAVDFMEKPFSPEGIIARVRQLYEVWKLEIENQQLKTQIGFRFNYEKMIGSSIKVLELKQMISQISLSDATVLIHGETGTGKELVAKAIHYHSPRAKNSFVAVDCASINETMLESELFGHIKGAYTGAHTSTKGLIRSADHGTLFFDEIGELPVQLQAKLLRVLQEREVRPVGSDTTSKVDIRVIAASNRDLKAEIGKNQFREDLYYRLEAITLHVPPLRDRTDDIQDLAEFFLNKYKTDFSTAEIFSKNALTAMELYSWPGNIRELENVIRRSMALCQSRVIQRSELPSHISPSGFESKPSDDSLGAYEKAAIKNALKKCNSHRKKAAKLLKIGEATLYRKIKLFWPDDSNE